MTIHGSGRFDPPFAFQVTQCVPVLGSTVQFCAPGHIVASEGAFVAKRNHSGGPSKAWSMSRFDVHFEANLYAGTKRVHTYDKSG